MDILWENPKALYALWLLVPVGALLVHAHARRIRAAARFADPAMGERLMPVLRGARPWVRGGLTLVALASFAVALARPRWGVYFEKVTQRGTDLVVLLDVSRSMLSPDVPPSRLERAKSDIEDFLRKVRGDRVGLVLFAGKAVPACPLTTDHGFFRTILEEAGPQSVPRGGTAIGDAIREALRVMPEARDRDQAILLITDGEETQDSMPLEAAATAAERRVKILAVGLGDPVEGSRVPETGASGQKSYLKYKDQEVWSKMDERLLREIALKTQGAYVPAKTQAYDLGDVYEKHLAGLTGGEIQSDKRKRYGERFQAFVVLGLAAILVEMLMSPYGRRIAPAIVLVAMASPGWAQSAESRVRDGIAQFSQGRYDEAARLFHEADVARPDDPVIAFDRAAALAAKGDAAGARPLYEQAAAARDPSLAARAQYNLGTMSAAAARAVFGEKPEETPPEKRQEGIAALQQAILHFRACLELDPGHADARRNLEILRLWLKQMASAWQARDREKERREMELLPFLERMMGAEKSLRRAVLGLESEADSPLRREQVRETGSAQAELAGDVGPLKQKIDAELAKAVRDEARRKPAAEAFGHLADDAGAAMRKAAEDLGGSQLGPAALSQAKAYRSLDEIWRELVPFEKVLEASTSLQSGTVDGTRPFAERAEEAPAGPLRELSEDETRVRELAAVLGRKAEQEPPAAPAPPPGTKCSRS